LPSFGPYGYAADEVTRLKEVFSVNHAEFETVDISGLSDDELDDVVGGADTGIVKPFGKTP
jgi:hypothetical protein